MLENQNHTDKFSPNFSFYEILSKCQIADLEFISDKLDTYFSPVDDKKRKKLLEQFKQSPQDSSIKNELLLLIDKQIRYFGSSDVAYLARSIMPSKDPFKSLNISPDEGGISAQELILDVCEKSKVKIKSGASVEASLERLVKAITESELAKKKPEELKREFEKLKIGNDDIQTILKQIHSRKGAILPIIQGTLGMEITGGITQSVVINILSSMMGKQAAAQLMKELARKNPWINSLGPIVWVASAGWLAYDIQGPAFRKTVPICLYLGIVALRDGAEEA